MKMQFVTSLILGLLAWDPASADAPNGFGEFPTPEGLTPCAPGSPLANVEARFSAKFGGVFLGCYQSERKITPPGAAETTAMPVESAFAIAVQGAGYTPADLDKMLSTVRKQWKDFGLLSKESKETYTVRLNDMIKGNDSTLSTPVSVKPVLISIDRSDSSYYSVTSVRSYSFKLGGKQVTWTKVNSDAVVLRSSQLIRLTIQRTLSDPADVAQVQGEIDKWARATVQSSMLKSHELRTQP